MTLDPAVTRELPPPRKPIADTVPLGCGSVRSRGLFAARLQTSILPPASDAATRLPSPDRLSCVTGPAGDRECFGTRINARRGDHGVLNGGIRRIKMIGRRCGDDRL